MTKEEHKFQLLQLVSYYGLMKKYFQMSEQTIAGLIIMIQNNFSYCFIILCVYVTASKQGWQL